MLIPVSALSLAAPARLLAKGAWTVLPTPLCASGQPVRTERQLALEMRKPLQVKLKDTPVD